MNKDELEIRTKLKTNLMKVPIPEYGLTINQELKDEIIAMKTTPNAYWLFVKAYFDDVAGTLGGTRFPWIEAESFSSQLVGVDEEKYPVTYEDGYLIFKTKIDISETRTLKGWVTDANEKSKIDTLIANSQKTFERVFLADLLWLFYYERMGIPKILGVMLDDFATKGNYPIDSSDGIARILDNMVVLTKAGGSSSVRDRESSYRRCLGWSSDVGQKLEFESSINTGFNNSFHKLIQYALEYYKEKRLALVIQGEKAPATPSAATLTTIKETMILLQESFHPFDYGRNHIITATGIAWVIVGMNLFRNIKDSFGIPTNYKEPAQYISALYTVLVEGKPASNSNTNRYIVNKQCAENGRDILLGVQGLGSDLSVVTDENLQLWLTLMETRIEAYRTAYRSLTGVDLGAPGVPTIEQQVSLIR